MKTKVSSKSNDLVDMFQARLGWNKSRAKFFVSFIFALCKVQTVCFNKLAQGFEGKAKVESNIRRIQRFFADFIVDTNLIAKLIFRLLPEKPPYRLCLDRTNWKYGKANINILMLSIAYHGVAIPILWTMLPKRGNSNTRERKELVQRFLDLFGEDCIEAFLADREFIGDDWFEKLIHNQTPFYIRIRGNMWLNIPGKGPTKAYWLFNSLSLNTAFHYHKIVGIDGQWVYLSGMKIFNREGKIEYVIVASFKSDPLALTKYKDRWQIETMFKAFKSSGFNFEDTHLIDEMRINKLIALASVAFVWVYLVGIFKNNNGNPIKIKKHGRRAYSLFKFGLMSVAHALLNPTSYKDIRSYIKILSCT
jgi:hypothetical protein